MPKSFPDPVPVILLKDILQRYPSLHTQIAAALTVRDTDPWPSWCYLPMSGAYAIATRGADVPLAVRYMQTTAMQDFQLLAALIPWLVAKPVLRFDAALAAELTAEPDARAAELPAAVLHRLPYPCVFIEQPPLLDGCQGVFAFLEYDMRYPDMTELRLLYIYPHEQIPVWYQFAGTLQAHGITQSTPTPHTQAVLDVCDRHLPLILYLCTDEPDAERAAPKPRSRSIHGRPAEASYPDSITVGATLGRALHTTRTAAADDAHGTPHRPHIRRAHWHTYLTGEGRTTPRLRWILPIMIHPEAADTPPTIYPVK